METRDYGFTPPSPWDPRLGAGARALDEPAGVARGDPSVRRALRFARGAAHDRARRAGWGLFERSRALGDRLDERESLRAINAVLVAALAGIGLQFLKGGELPLPSISLGQLLCLLAAQLLSLRALLLLDRSRGSLQSWLGDRKRACDRAALAPPASRPHTPSRTVMF